MRTLSGQSWRKPTAAVASLMVISSAGVWVNATAATAATSDACWATAVTASQCGGMSALVAAAKAEGHLTVTTDPFTWANYGLLIPGFEKQYGIKVLDTNPLSSQTSLT
jgi:putative spermidine/putrescine transport system substrate-binding protein